MMWQAGSLCWNVRKTGTGGGRVSGLVLQRKKGVTWDLLTALFWMMIFHKMG